MYKRILKRLLDIVLSFLGLIILSPILIIVAILVRIFIGSPVIFKQKRPGLENKIFEMYKFRSMNNRKDSSGKLLSDEARLTKFGKILRKSSLDELPELFNILKGDMSIVGPRPQLVRDMTFMDHKTLQRHSVTPGLTGWAQVNGRNSISWDDKFKYDLEYVENMSFMLDVKILMLTIKKVFISEGVSADGMATAEDYGDYLLRVNKVSKGDYDMKQYEAKKLLRNKDGR